MVLLLIGVSAVPFVVRSQDNLVDAGLDQTVYVGQVVNFKGSVSADPSSIVTIQWDFGDGSPPANGSNPALLNTTTHIYTTDAVYNATLSVRFNSVLNKTETDTVAIVVRQNLPPVANAGPDQIVEQTSPAGAEVTLNATGSSDPYNDPLTYHWNWTGDSATGTTPTTIFPPGNTTVTLTVSDGQFNSTDAVNIVVRDTTPPQITVAATPSTLWPPNHQYLKITITVTTYDLGDPSPSITLVSITSSEPDNSYGDGNTADDIAILDDFTFNLRAERSGPGSGRIYTITYQATDASGNVASASITIETPHNQ
jgi:hypothetical protein